MSYHKTLCFSQYRYTTNSMEQSSLEKLIVAQLVKKFSAFYGSRSFIIVITRAPYWSLSWTYESSHHPIYL